MPKEYDAPLARTKQAELCKKKDAPHFAPESGVCWACRRNIYEPWERLGFTSGVTVKHAETKLITGCPHCNRSYCD